MSNGPWYSCLISKYGCKFSDTSLQYRGPPRVLGEQGEKGIYFRGTKAKFEGNRGTKTILSPMSNGPWYSCLISKYGCKFSDTSLQYRGPPRVFGEQGEKGIYYRGTKAKFEGNRGTKTILGTGYI